MLSLMNKKFLSKLAMPYGIASKPLNSNPSNIYASPFCPNIWKFGKIMPGTG